MDEDHSSRWRAIPVDDFEAPKPADAVRIFCFSDTHIQHDKIPNDQIIPADIGIMIGDFTQCGAEEDVVKFRDWYIQQPFKYRVLIAGNHEITFDEKNREDIIQRFEAFYRVPVESIKPMIYHPDLIYAENETLELCGLKIFCSPNNPFFYNWAFPTWIEENGAAWEQIQPGTDIIATHGPPYGVLDKNKRDERSGDEFLTKKVMQIKPALHVFGHAHSSYGLHIANDITFANVSVLNESYFVTNKPMVFDMIKQ